MLPTKAAEKRRFQKEAKLEMNGKRNRNQRRSVFFPSTKMRVLLLSTTAAEKRRFHKEAQIWKNAQGFEISVEA